MQAMPFFLVNVILLSGNHSFQWTLSLLVEALPFSGRNHSLQSKSCFLVEAMPFSGSHSFLAEALTFCEGCFFQRRKFLLKESIPFSVNTSSQWKQSLLVEVITLSRSRLFQWKTFLWCKSSFSVEAVSFGGYTFQQKPFLSAEAVPFR